MNTTADKKIEIFNEQDWRLIEASKLSVDDAFMRYKTTSVKEELLKRTIAKAIKAGITDFYRPVMDPSFADESKTKIHYMAGEEPAVGKSYNWWEEVIKDTELSIGTKFQYAAFLGVLIKMLVDRGWSYKEAWHAVCLDSKDLGHYCNSDNAKGDQFESTGSREICGFFDLANTMKILAKDEKEDGFWSTTCFRFLPGGFCPLSQMILCKDCSSKEGAGVGWLVRNK